MRQPTVFLSPLPLRFLSPLLAKWTNAEPSWEMICDPGHPMPHKVHGAVTHPIIREKWSLNWKLRLRRRKVENILWSL